MGDAKDTTVRDACADALKRLLDGDPGEEISREDLIQILTFVVGGVSSMQRQIDALKTRVDGSLPMTWQ